MTMYCEYCHGNGYHHPQCPNYEQPKTRCYCSICNNGIYSGEEYIENDIGERVHLDCIYNIKELLNFLGYKIEIMEDE